MIRHFSIALCLIGATLASGQTLTTNAEGQRVIVYPDGSTRLFDDPGSGAPNEVPLGSAATPQQEDEAREAVREQIKVLRDELKSLTSIAKNARGQEAKLNKRIQKLRTSNKSSDRSQIEIVNQKLIAARAEYGSAEAARLSSEARSNALTESVNMSIARRQAYMSSLGLGYLVGAPSDDGVTPVAAPGGADQQAPTPPAPVAEVSGGGGRRNRGSAASFVSYDITRDPKFYPPTPKCMRESEGIDEFTNNVRITLAPEVFFTFTSPELKPFLGAASLLTCNARLVKTGRSVVLETEYVIRSQFAATEFGVLARGAQVTFRTVDGQKIVMRNQTASQANYDPVTKVSTYKGRYVLNKGTVKMLEKSLLDEVRVMWGTGFDDYQIYDMAFLRRQLACL